MKITYFQTVLCAILSLGSLVSHLSLLLLLLLLFSPYYLKTTELSLPDHIGPSFSLLLSISALDLVTFLLGTPYISYYNVVLQDWLFGKALCRLSAFLWTASLTMASYGYLALLLICYLLVFKKEALKWVSTPARQTLLVGGLWALSLGSGLPRLLLQKTFAYKGLGTDQGDPFSVPMYVPTKEFNLTESLQWAPNGTEIFENQLCVPTGFTATEDGKFLYVFFQFYIPLGFVIYFTAKILNATDVGFKQKKKDSTTEPQIALSNEDLMVILTSLLNCQELVQKLTFFLFFPVCPLNYPHHGILSPVLGIGTLYSLFSTLVEATYKRNRIHVSNVYDLF